MAVSSDVVFAVSSFSICELLDLVLSSGKAKGIWSIKGCSFFILWLCEVYLCVRCRWSL